MFIRDSRHVSLVLHGAVDRILKLEPEKLPASRRIILQKRYGYVTSHHESTIFRTDEATC